MKFEEVLPALREGKKIRRKCMRPDRYHIFDEIGQLYTFGVEADILQNDWEVVEEKKKVKLRDLTNEQYINYCKTRTHCRECLFRDVACVEWYSWIKHKDLCSDEFLDQEIEVEE